MCLAEMKMFFESIDGQNLVLANGWIGSKFAAQE
jgi:hypothetical protein